ncbi:MAG: energy coupling factor transporter S component ThiW [Promethearchaeota archaeon]
MSEEKHIEFKNKTTIRIAVTAILIAVGVVLSYLNPFAYFTIAGTKINPFAHLINVLSGVLLGLLFSIVTAFGIAIIRFATGIGSIHAFHGGISGALIVSIISYILQKKKPKYAEYAAFVEPLGTVFLGGTIAEIVIPIFGTFSMEGLLVYWGLFFLPSIVGCALGFIILKILKDSGYSWETFTNK